MTVDEPFDFEKWEVIWGPDDSDPGDEIDQPMLSDTAGRRIIGEPGDIPLEAFETSLAEAKAALEAVGTSGAFMLITAREVEGEPDALDTTFTASGGKLGISFWSMVASFNTWAREIGPREDDIDVIIITDDDDD